MTHPTSSMSATKRPRRMAREPKPVEAIVPVGEQSASNEPVAPTSHVPPDKGPTKTDTILALLTRAEGVTLEQMVEATCWLPHTTRAALTGLKKKGHEVTSVKADGVRTYRAVDKREDQTSAEAITSGPLG